jgi:hypothetical protein
MSHRWNLLAPRRRAALVVASTACALFATAGSAQAATLPTVTIGVSASAVTVGGPLQSGAVNVVSTSTKKETEVILFLLKPGVSVAEVEAFVKSNKQKDPNNATKYGTIAFDVEASPGAMSEAQTDLQAGQYIVLTGEGEKPVAIRTTFTVAPAASPVAMPTPAATIRSIEFAFRGPTTLHDGELVRFENEGFLVHMDIAFPVKSRAGAQEVVKDLLAGKEKGLEKLVAGAPFAFTGPVSSGAFQQETITAKPGWYVQACFMDTQDGREHTQLGMERIFKIVK